MWREAVGGSTGPVPAPVASGAVRLAGVTRLFDGAPAVALVSLSVATGASVWLRGPNGSGKSTLLRIVGTVLSPTFGGGEVLGHDLVRGRQSIRASTELLGHQPRLYDDLTAVENLRFVCDLYSLEPRGAPLALERVGLHEVARERVGGFSQGMRQRLALARCWLRDPPVLLLDEPYAGLDSDARGIVDDLLVHARAAGHTVLIASHEAPPPRLIDDVVAVAAGRVVPSPARTAS